MLLVLDNDFKMFIINKLRVFCRIVSCGILTRAMRMDGEPEER